MIVGPDGQIPYTPEARKRDAARDRDSAGRYPTPFFHQSWLEFDIGERCLTDGVQGALLGGPAGGPSQFMQSPGWLAILHEARNDRRTIPTDGRPHGNVRDWRGDAVGRWEGDTLVIETTNFARQVALQVGRALDNRDRDLAPGRAFHARRRGHDRLLAHDRGSGDVYETLDPDVSSHEAFGPALEYACHEGNYGVIHPLSSVSQLREGRRRSREEGEAGIEVSRRGSI